MNGWQLADRVRGDHAGTRFYLVTGWGAVIDPDDARTRGVHGVISKPYLHSEIRRMLTSGPSLPAQPPG